MIAFLQLRWLGRTRVRAYSIILALVSAVSMIWMFQRAMGPDGSDFQAFWSAGRLVLSGAAADAYDPAVMAGVQAKAGLRDVFAFVNPPPMLLAVWLLALLEYPLAWVAWVAATYGVWLVVTRRLAPELTWPIAAFPGALVAAWHAQTGFFTSIFQALAALWLRERPFCAGLCIGALVVKPQLALLFPVALLAARLWRVIAGAAVSVAGLLLLSWLLLGSETMLAYPQSWAVSDYLLRTGSDEFFLRQVTPYAMVRVMAGHGAALTVQAAVTLAMAALTWRAWARAGPYEGKLALLFAATPLATPYLFSYDLPFLIIPLCWLVREHRSAALGNWERPVLLALYLSPLVTRAMALPAGLNPMPLVLLALVALIWRRLQQPSTPIAA